MTERTKKQGISNERELTGAGIAIRSAAQHYSCFIIMIHSLSIGNESGTQAVGNNIIIFFKYLSHREGSLFTYLSLLRFRRRRRNQKLRYFIPHLQNSQIARFAQMMTNAAAPVQKVLMVAENQSSPDECACKSWIFVKKSDFFMFFLSK